MGVVCFKLWCNDLTNFVLRQWLGNCNWFSVFWKKKKKKVLRFSLVLKFLQSKLELFISVDIQRSTGCFILWLHADCWLEEYFFDSGGWMFFRCSHVIIRGLSKASTVPKVRTKRRHWRHSQTSLSRSVPRWTSTPGSDTRSKPEKTWFLSLQHTSAPKHSETFYQKSWNRDHRMCNLTVAEKKWSLNTVASVTSPCWTLTRPKIEMWIQTSVCGFYYLTWSKSLFHPQYTYKLYTYMCKSHSQTIWNKSCIGAALLCINVTVITPGKQFTS